VLDPQLIGSAEATVRGIAAAGRSLRLYPPTSSIPRQAVDTAMASLSSFLEQEQALPLNVAREGFTCRGTAIGTTASSGSDLAEMLRSHGVAEVVFLPGCTSDDLLNFLGVIMRAPEAIRAEGGATAALSAAGTSGIRVVTVSLSVSAVPDMSAEADGVDEFFRELASDPGKLATWLAAAAEGDPATLADGLAELADAAPDRDAFLGTLAAAFGGQETEAKDVLLGIGMEPGRGRDLVGGMLHHLPQDSISMSLAGGVYGKNMLSLSTALTRLPLGERMEDIIAEVRAALPGSGHEEREVGFLDHMVSVRMSPETERPLAEADSTYRAVAAAAVVSADALDAKRHEVAESVAHTAARSVPTMLALLDQQRDFGLYVKSLDNLAAIVPRLVKQHELETVVGVLSEIAERESRESQPWPELNQRLRAALTASTGRATMAPLVDVVLADPEAIPAAHAILRVADDSGKIAFVEEALLRRDDRALEAAESLLGRRMIDLLGAAAPRVGPAQLGPLVRRLAREGDPAAMAAIEAALRRPDEMARAAAAEALTGTTNPAIVRLLAALLKDASPKVVSTAARALAGTRLPGTAEALATHLDTLDVDNRDFAIGREIIGCLAQMPETAAAQALRRLAERKSLMKRGRFNEVQQLAREAMTVQAQRSAR
jgi:hypothetical protein